jgi:hypothetical protein
MLQKSISCFQELRLSFIKFDVSVLLCSAFAWSWTDVWVLICYFQPFGGAFLRALQKLYMQWARGLLAGRMLDEDDLCNFPLCREVPFEQDSIE